MKERPIKDYYELAEKFLNLTWHDKFTIGVTFNVISKHDFSIETEELNTRVFVNLIKKGRYLQLVEECDRVYFKKDWMEDCIYP